MFYVFFSSFTWWLLPLATRFRRAVFFYLGECNLTNQFISLVILAFLEWSGHYIDWLPWKSPIGVFSKEEKNVKSTNENMPTHSKWLILNDWNSHDIMFGSEWYLVYFCLLTQKNVETKIGNPKMEKKNWESGRMVLWLAVSIGLWKTIQTIVVVVILFSKHRKSNLPNTTLRL